MNYSQENSMQTTSHLAQRSAVLNLGVMFEHETHSIDNL